MPAGKVAFNTSIELIFSFNSHSTFETICITWEYRSINILSVRETLPVLAILPKSFLPRSISIKCSAISFSSDKRSFSRSRSSCSVFPLERVPAIGLIVAILLLSTRVNISGEEPTIAKSFKLRKYIYGEGLSILNCRYSSTGFDLKAQLNRWDGTTCITSPALMYF